MLGLALTGINGLDENHTASFTPHSRCVRKISQAILISFRFPFPAFDRVSSNPHADGLTAGQDGVDHNWFVSKNRIELVERACPF